MFVELLLRHAVLLDRRLIDLDAKAGSVGNSLVPVDHLDRLGQQVVAVHIDTANRRPPGVR